MNDDTDGKVFKLGVVEKPEAPTIPENEYIIVDYDDNEHFATGFLLFTGQHVAVMRDIGAGSLPIFVMPLDRVKYASIIEDDDDEDAPF